jgi:hypothetical protein
MPAEVACDHSPERYIFELCCCQCGLTDESRAAGLDVEPLDVVLPGVVAMDRDQLLRWSRLHGVTWDRPL